MMKRVMLALGTAFVWVGSAWPQAAPPALPLPSQPSPTSTYPACAWSRATDPLLNEPTEGPNNQYWFSADYLFAWMQGNRLGPLVTTSPAGTPTTSAGVLGLPTTGTLFSGSTNDGMRPGVRLGAGYWFNPDTQRLGVEGGFMMLGSQATIYGASSSGNPILARPYFDVTANSGLGAPASLLVAYPGQSSGSIYIKESSGNFYMTNLDLTENFLDLGWLRLNSFIGYVFYRFDDGLRMQQTIAPTGGSFVPGTQLTATDSFVGQNTFNGADLGFRSQFFWKDFSLNVLGRFAVGEVHNRVLIDGLTTTAVPGSAPVTSVGGLYALSSNITNTSGYHWAVLPEFGLNLGWYVRPSLRLSVGYSLLFLNQIARGSNQVDYNINPGLIPPVNQTPGSPSNPALNQINRDGLWIQSLTLGAQLAF